MATGLTIYHAQTLCGSSTRQYKLRYRIIFYNMMNLFWDDISCYMVHTYLIGLEYVTDLRYYNTT